MEEKMFEELSKLYAEMVSLRTKLEYLNGRLHAGQVYLDLNKYPDAETLAKMIGLVVNGTPESKNMPDSLTSVLEIEA